MLANISTLDAVTTSPSNDATINTTVVDSTSCTNGSCRSTAIGAGVGAPLGVIALASLFFLRGSDGPQPLREAWGADQMETAVWTHEVHHEPWTHYSGDSLEGRSSNPFNLHSQGSEDACLITDSFAARYIYPFNKGKAL
jgi:hypothetical protein